MSWKTTNPGQVPPCAKERGGTWQYDDSGREIDLTKAIKDAHPDC